MVRQLVAFAFVMILIVQIEADRIRRQSGNAAEPDRIARRQSPSNPVPCAIKCSWSFSQAWSKTVGFEVPTINMVPKSVLSGDDNIFQLLCGLYDLTQVCVRGCAAANSANEAMRVALHDVDPSCNRTSELVQEMPCVTQNASIFRRACAKESEDLLAASIRLTTQTKIDPSLPRQFCKAANLQAYCILPIVRQTCGDLASQTIRQLANASLWFVRASVDDDLINAFYPECAQYFETIQNGVPSFDRMMKNSTILFGTNSTLDNHNSTAISDRAGSQLPWGISTTPASSNAISSTSSFFVLLFGFIFRFSF